MIETKVLKTNLSLPHCHPAFVPTRYVLEKGDNVLKTMSTTFVTHQRPPCYSLLPDSSDPRREVQLSNLSSVTPVSPHQVKQTPHETRYTRRPRTEMCQNVRSGEDGNRKGKKKTHRRNRNVTERALYPGSRQQRGVPSPCQVATT
jgi:hypothetical protein